VFHFSVNYVSLQGYLLAHKIIHKPATIIQQTTDHAYTIQYIARETECRIVFETHPSALLQNLQKYSMNQTQTVHLTECLDLFSESNSFDSEVRDCLSTFFLKTTTNFHNADMQFNPLFGALCWSFTLGGFVMVTVKPKWVQRSNFPYRLYAYVLMFVQGMFGGILGLWS
jgi:hypothetical protein